MIQGAREALRSHKSILLQAPTGAGKTVLASFIISQTAARGDSAWFICHRVELVDGTSNTFTKFGIRHGFIAAGYNLNLSTLVQICSIDTLKNRLGVLKAPRVVIIDESHHSSAAGWALVIAWLKSAGTLIIGLSATPRRLDGRPLDKHFDFLVPGPTVSWLMENGHLSQYRYFAPDTPDMKGVRKQMGDFAKKDAAEKMDRPKLTGNIIKHWRNNAEGLRTVGFAVNLAHSQHLTQSFIEAGIPAAHLDGNTDKGERKRIIQRYAAGDILVLFNVGLFGEGFDLSAIAQTDVTIDALIDAAPTQSLAAVVQRWGRVLRPRPGKTAIINDHAGNNHRHGYPDDEREWSLEGEEDGTSKGGGKTDGPPPPVICSKCFNSIKRPIPNSCPHCGNTLIKAEEIKVAEGVLKEQTEKDKAMTRRKLAEEMAQAKTLDQLVALGQRIGKKSPMTWAHHQFMKRR
jgi:superfamily II DNA or RNA helicase